MTNSSVLIKVDVGVCFIGLGAGVNLGAEQEEYERWHGGKIFGQRNEEGKMILDMVRASDLVLGNTIFSKSPEQTYTYKSGQNRMVLDYINTQRYFRQCYKLQSDSRQTCLTTASTAFNGLEDKQKRRTNRVHAKRINRWKLKTEKGEELSQKLGKS